MKKILLLILFIIPLFCIAQEKKSSKKPCAPVVNGKVCYVDKVNMTNVSKDELFRVINKWATKTYGKDMFVSNVSANKAKGTILISSKVELVMSKRETTNMKFKIYITCTEENYSVRVTDIVYQYDHPEAKRFKTYPAEDVILNNGKDNKVSVIRDPQLFCKATYSFAENIFGDIFYVAWEGD